MNGQDAKRKHLQNHFTFGGAIVSKNRPLNEDRLMKCNGRSPAGFVFAVVRGTQVQDHYGFAKSRVQDQ